MKIQKKRSFYLEKPLFFLLCWCRCYYLLLLFVNVFLSGVVYVCIVFFVVFSLVQKSTTSTPTIKFKYNFEKMIDLNWNKRDKKAQDERFLAWKFISCDEFGSLNNNNNKNTFCFSWSNMLQRVRVELCDLCVCVCVCVLHHRQNRDRKKEKNMLQKC